MLDCKMTSLSPATPLSCLSECYGIWDQETLPSSIVTKLENTDMMEFGEPSLTSPTSLDCPGVMTLHPDDHPHRNEFTVQFQSSAESYLPIMGNDPYSPPECQILENFHCIGNLDSHYHKLSDASSYSENYDNFIPDLLQHQVQAHPHHTSSPHLGLNSLGQGSIGAQHHQVIPSSSYFVHEAGGGISNHVEYNCIWDPLNSDPSTAEFYIRKGCSPTTSESIMSYTDIDSEIDSKSSRESLSTFTEICRTGSPPKRRVGRPPKKDKKLKRAAEKKTGRLWEFIRDLLKNPDYCPSLVRWENPEEGHFRFVNSEKVAQLWGQIKGNPRMTYEKLSRAMRYYYKSHVFEPVLGRRLVYKFGYNATNWRPVNPNFVQKLYN